MQMHKVTDYLRILLKNLKAWSLKPFLKKTYKTPTVNFYYLQF